LTTAAKSSASVTGRWHLVSGRRLIRKIENDDPYLKLPRPGAE
jgi:hypothetical protein